MTHAHAWEPVPGWSARYRCCVAGCGALGYKPVMRVMRSDDAKISGPQERDAARPFEVIPYLCKRTVEGAACGQPAITHSQWAGQFCREHQRVRA